MLRNKTKKGPYKIFIAREQPKGYTCKALYAKRRLERDCVPIRLVAKQTKMAELVTLVNKHI